MYTYIEIHIYKIDIHTTHIHRNSQAQKLIHTQMHTHI